MKIAIALIATIVSAHAARKNVLFLAVDDFRDQMGSLGPAVTGPGCGLKEGDGCTKMLTPNLDQFATEALVLQKNYVQQGVCSPTRTSILTSRRPDATRVWDLYSYFRDVSGNYTTIPQFFRESGYLTVGMGKIFHPGHASGEKSPHCNDCPRGDDMQYSWDAYFHAPNNNYPLAPGDGPLAFLSVPPEQEEKYPLADTQLADHAIETLTNYSKGPKDKPFFIAFGGHRPHLPFVAPQAKFDLYPIENVSVPEYQTPPIGMPRAAWTGSGELFSYGNIHGIANRSHLDINEVCLIAHIPHTPPHRDAKTLPEKYVKELRQAYYAASSHMDEQMGRVLTALKDLGLEQDTIVSFWGDHGWSLGDAGMWCKHSNFEPVTRAPMMIKVPGLTDGGKRTLQYTEHIDLFPTLAELAMNVTIEPCPSGHQIENISLCTMGKSLVPLMHDPENAPGFEASFSQYPRGRASSQDEYEAASPPSICLKEACIMGYSVITRLANHEYRYTEWVALNENMSKTMNWDKSYGRELYDMDRDGTEPHYNRAGDDQYHDVQESLKALLHQGPSPGGWGPWQQ